MTLKKSKGKEKTPHLSEKLLMHVHLHSFKEFNIEGNSLLVPLNEPIRGKGGKRALEHPKMDKFSKA